MHRVLLVDDEPISLEGLSLLIDWEAEGFQIAGQCSCAQEALSLLQADSPPDLVVTDLYMPGMSGLELMQTAQECGFPGIFVVVSGYGEFRLAQEALHLGALGYLLKPLDPAEASQTLLEVRRALVKRRNISRTPRRAHLHALLMQRNPPDATLLPEGFWAVVMCGAPRNLLSNALPHPGTDAYWFLQKGSQYVVLYHAEETSLRKAVDGFVRECAKENRQPLVSAPSHSPASLALAAQSFETLLEERAANCAALYAQMLRSVSWMERAAFESCVEPLAGLLMSHSATLAQDTLRKWREQCHAMLRDLPEQANAFLSQAGPETILEEEHLAQEFQRIGSLTLDLFSRQSQSLSAQIMRYIEQHYQESISLYSMGETLRHNPAYLGKVFRQQVGQFFRPWLNDYRLSQAARMLCETDLPIHHIARHVGYVKYAYFLEKFKQRFGQSPEQYRKDAKG